MRCEYEECVLTWFYQNRHKIQHLHYSMHFYDLLCARKSMTVDHVPFLGSCEPFRKERFGNHICQSTVSGTILLMLPVTNSTPVPAQLVDRSGWHRRRAMRSCQWPPTSASWSNVTLDMKQWSHWYLVLERWQDPCIVFITLVESVALSGKQRVWKETPDVCRHHHAHQLDTLRSNICLLHQILHVYCPSNIVTCQDHPGRVWPLWPTARSSLGRSRWPSRRALMTSLDSVGSWEMDSAMEGWT